MSTGKAHPDDVLIVGTLSEKTVWPEFGQGQVIPLPVLDRALLGRTFRRAYVTSQAVREMDTYRWSVLDISRANFGGEIVDAVFWQPEPEPTRWQRLGRRLLALCERFA